MEKKDFWEDFIYRYFYLQERKRERKMEGGREVKLDYSREGSDIEIDHESSGGSTEAKEFNSMREPLLLRNRKNTTSQIAIVGANACPIESLDYEILENELFKQDWRTSKKVQIYQYVFLKWTFALLIGLGTGLVGLFNNLAVENIAGFKFLLTSSLMLEKNAVIILHLLHMLVVT